MATVRDEEARAGAGAGERVAAAEEKEVGRVVVSDEEMEASLE